MSREIIFEITRMGDYVKVSAVDPVTMVEVSVVGPSRGSLEAVKAVAVRKLRRAIERGA
jgi:hypothetical protein